MKEDKADTQNDDMTLRWIENEGKVYREVSANPTKLILVVGMYLLLLPIVLVSAIATYEFIYLKEAPHVAAVFILVGLLSLFVLIKTTWNYIKIKIQKKP
ncbi:hypothetical protein P4B35_23660 [Pontiellaceae bacterium B12227]|nr:hypothetical protein [Pontiellaceae bacterium B12227]